MRCCVRCLLSSRTLILFAIACGLSNFQEDWCRNFPHLEINGDIFYHLKIESSATWCLLTTDDFLRIAMAFNVDIFSQSVVYGLVGQVIDRGLTKSVSTSELRWIVGAWIANMLQLI